MSKRQTLMLLGVSVISFLFLGFTSFWDKLIAITIGVAIIFISYNLVPETIRAKKLDFVEHKNDGVTEKDSTEISQEKNADIIKEETTKIS